MKLEGNEIYLRLLEPADAQAMLDLHVRNREFFRKYATTRGDEYFTLEVQEKIIKDGLIKKENDQRYSFGIFLKETNELIGNIGLSEVIRGPLQSCYIGYYLDEKHNGKGYMSEAVSLAVKYGFEELKLHRIEAGVMPHNTGSIRVLEKAGFIKEGIARKNVNIDGEWRDHQILAIVDDDYINQNK